MNIIDLPFGNLLCILAEPRDMKEALEIFKQSTYMKELLGDHIFNKYVEAKSAEWESYQKFVSQWEVDRYLYKI